MRPTSALVALVVGTLACGTRTLNLGRAGDAGAADADAAVALFDSGEPNTPGSRQSFAVSYFRLGITKRNGETAADAWRDYGFDLDGICTTADDSATSAGTCKRVDGSPGGVLADGEGCRDNNFGSRLVSFIKTLDPQAETKIVDGFKKGGGTLVLRIDDLAEVGDDGSAPAALLAGKGADGSAKLDGSDTMDIDGTSLDALDLEKPLAKLGGFVKIRDGHRIWNGKADRLDLPAVFIAGSTGAIPIRAARIEIDLDTKQGTIAGYAAMTDVQKLVIGLLGNRGICDGNPAYDAVLRNVSQAADMPLTLPHDPSKTCEALSIGLGIEVVSTKIGKAVPPGMPKPDPCKM